MDFFLTFVYQYIAFKTRNIDYLKPIEKNDFDTIKQITRREGFDDLTGLIKSVEYSYTHENVDILWNTVREAPLTIAHRKKEFIVQMIDEFQFMNAMIYWDKKKSKDQLADNLAGGYLSTAENKIAPLLVSGSWVGWLMNELNSMLPARFKYEYLENMPEDEAVEILFKYSMFFKVPVSEETVFLMIHILEGNPFYLTSLIRSGYKDKDLTTTDGLTRTLEFETLDDHGVIKSTWMEYMKRAFSRVDDRNAKRIVLHLYKHNGRELTRKGLMDGLKLDMSDMELEKKLEAPVKADIIRRGSTNFGYRGVNDNIFAKVFRSVYQKEIDHFDADEIN